MSSQKHFVYIRRYCIYRRNAHKVILYPKSGVMHQSQFSQELSLKCQFELYCCELWFNWILLQCLTRSNCFSQRSRAFPRSREIHSGTIRRSWSAQQSRLFAIRQRTPCMHWNAFCFSPSSPRLVLYSQAFPTSDLNESQAAGRQSGRFHVAGQRWTFD